jgi:hypothetical protein
MSIPPKPPKLRIEGADLPRDYLAEIADVTVAWAYLSNLLEVAIWGMLALNTRQGAALTAPFHFHQKLTMLRSIGRQFFENSPQQQTFKELCTKIENTYTERNDIEHSTWQHLHPSMPVTRARQRKNRTIDAQFVKKDDIEEMGQRIIRLFIDLNEFAEKYIPEPSPTKPQPQ